MRESSAGEQAVHPAVRHISIPWLQSYQHPPPVPSLPAVCSAVHPFEPHSFTPNCANQPPHPTVTSPCPLPPSAATPCSTPMLASSPPVQPPLLLTAPKPPRSVATPLQQCWLA